MQAGIAIAERPGQADQVGHGPLEATLGELDHDVDPGEAGGGDEGLGRLDHQRRRPWLDDGRSEIDRDHRPLPGQVEGVEARLPALDPGQAQGVPGIEAVAHVEPPGRVPHRTGDAPDHHGQRRLQGLGPLGDAAEGRLEPEQAGETGRDADGAATVTAAGDGEQAPGHGRRRPARGSARGALADPRGCGWSRAAWWRCS